MSLVYSKDEEDKTGRALDIFLWISFWLSFARWMLANNIMDSHQWPTTFLLVNYFLCSPLGIVLVKNNSR